jgi:scyllo-inositol 2-dehydrogenase (NADP+)
MMESVVKVGIAGLGRSGWDIHAKVLERLPLIYEVVAVADPIKERLNEAEKKFGCRTYSDFDSFAADDDIELVVIATPTYLHAAHTIKALKSGKKVVCEKPMAANLAEADAMIKTAKEAGNLLTIFHNKRYWPDFLKVKEVIRSGKLGRIVFVRITLHSFARRWDWQTLTEFGGGELRNNGVHLIDQALQLMGDVEPEVFCDLQRTLTSGDAEDHVKLTLKAPGPPVVDIEVTHACAYPQDYWLVMGTSGGLTGGGSSLRWKYVDLKALPPRMVEIMPTSDRSFNTEELNWTEETWELNKDSVLGESAFYEELYETLRHGGRLGVTPESSRRVMSIIEKCYQCSRRDD